MNDSQSPDRRWLYSAVLARSLATGMMGVLLGIYLASLDLNANAIGLVIGLGLAGAAFSTLLVTFFSDRIGRRRTLLILTSLSVAGAVMLALSASVLTLGIAAFLGSEQLVVAGGGDTTFPAREAVRIAAPVARGTAVSGGGGPAPGGRRRRATAGAGGRWRP